MKPKPTTLTFISVPVTHKVKQKSIKVDRQKALLIEDLPGNYMLPKLSSTVINGSSYQVSSYKFLKTLTDVNYTFLPCYYSKETLLAS